MLKIYIGFAVDPGECAVLVFAHNRREAIKLTWPVLQGWGVSDNYIDTRVWMLVGKEFLRKQAKPDLLAQDIAHVIDSPEACVRCELWGISELNDKHLCRDCVEVIEDGVDG